MELINCVTLLVKKKRALYNYNIISKYSYFFMSILNYFFNYMFSFCRKLFLFFLREFCTYKMFLKKIRDLFGKYFLKQF